MKEDKKIKKLPKWIKIVLGIFLAIILAIAALLFSSSACLQGGEKGPRIF